MKLVKTPLRISLFGGGTDYPSYFEKARSVVVGGTIDKFIYTSALPLFIGSEEVLRLNYRRTESVREIDELSHPIVREWLRRNPIANKVNISTVSDIPGGSGLGSSSAFSVGFIDLVDWLRGEERSRESLARAAIYLEREILQERVGYQDQYHASFGGFSAYSFTARGASVSNFDLGPERLAHLSASCHLVFTGKFRSASSVLNGQEKRNVAGANDKYLERMNEISEEAVQIFGSLKQDLDLFAIGKLLSESWRLKRELSPAVSNDIIESISSRLRKLGCFGTKVLGAGSGGFVLGLGPPEIRERIKDEFGPGNVVPFNFINHGSQRVSLSVNK